MKYFILAVCVFAYISSYVSAANLNSRLCSCQQLLLQICDILDQQNSELVTINSELNELQYLVNDVDAEVDNEEIKLNLILQNLAVILTLQNATLQQLDDQTDILGCIVDNSGDLSDIVDQLVALINTQTCEVENIYSITLQADDCRTRRTCHRV